MYDYSLQGESAAGEATRSSKLRKILARRGFTPSEDGDAIGQALDMGVEALGGGLVPAATVRACEMKTRRCFFVRLDADGRANAFIALLFLNAAGYAALMFGRFEPGDPDLAHLCDPDERALAIYVWCLAGSTPQARRAVGRAVTEARRKAFPDIALFARPVSREGRMMTASLDAPGAGAAFLGWVPAKSGLSTQRVGTEDGRCACGRVQASAEGARRALAGGLAEGHGGARPGLHERAGLPL